MYQIIIYALKNATYDRYVIYTSVSLDTSKGACIERIGVPQGGALSGLIANIALNEADKKMQETQQ